MTTVQPLRGFRVAAHLFALLGLLLAAPAFAQSSAAPLFAATLHDYDDKPFAFEQVSAALERVLPAEADPG